MYATHYDQNSSDSVRSESYPQTEFSSDQIERINQIKTKEYSTNSSIRSKDTPLSLGQSPYFGGESLTLYASGGEPVTLYANTAGVVSQGFQGQQGAPSTKSEAGKHAKTITLLPPPGMTKKFLQQRTLQPKPTQIQSRTNYQNSMLLNLQPSQLKSNSRLINILPNSGEVQKLKLVSPGQKFYPMNSKSDENFQICLKLDEYGRPTVSLTGNQKKFIQHIHQAVLNFMRDHKIPVSSFCQHVLQKREEDSLSIFLTRTNWETLTIEEKMTYLRLNDWLKQPVTKRMYDLIQKETDIDKRREMTNQFVEATTIKKEPDHAVLNEDFVHHPMKPKEPIAVNDVARESPTNIFQSEQLESSEPQEEFTEQYYNQKPTSQADGRAILAELQAGRHAGPPRSRTTQYEREAIRFWSSQHPNPILEEKKKLARSLGLSLMAVSRLLAYDKRSIHKKEETKLVEKFNNYDSSGAGGNRRNGGKEQFENLYDYNEPQTPALYETVKNPAVVENPHTKPRIVTGNPTSNPKSQFIQINSEKIKAVIRNAMKSGNAGFDPKKSFKVVIKPDGSSKYNKLALDSYFKNKLNPTEAQIAYFVQCTKVPYKVTKEYLSKRNEAQLFSDMTPSYVAAKNNEFQNKLNLKAEQKMSYARNQVQQQNTQVQLQQNSQVLLQQNSQDEFHQNSPDQFQPQIPSTSQPGNLQNLSEDQIAWMENFYQNTPNPDMQTIIDFSKCIDVPFGTVAEFLENKLDSKQQNIAPTETDTRAEANEVEDTRNIDPEILDLVRKISKKTYSPVLEKELKSLFGDKIFCTLDDIKSYATANSLNYQVIYRKLNNQDSVQLVSEETCKRLLGANNTAIKSEPIEYSEPKENESVDNFAPNPINESHDDMLSPNSWDKPVQKQFEDASTDTPVDVLKTKQVVESTYNGLSISLVPKDAVKIKQEPEIPDNAAGIPTNNWLTSTELLFEENEMRDGKVVCKSEPVFDIVSGGDFETELIEIDVETSIDEENVNKRKHSEENFPSKRHKTQKDDLSYDDSGYTTNEDSIIEGTDTLASSDMLSNIIMENIGEVNMLDDSLDLFNDSIKGIDLVNDMYQKIEDEDASMNDHVKVKLEVEELSDEENMMANLFMGENSPGSSIEITDDPSTFSVLRKVFYGPFENFHPNLQVVSIKPGFKSDVFEVELSDGKEFSSNFYFKTGSAALKINLMIKLKQLRYIGARICVESFESVKLENSILGNPQPIEDEFFSNLRASKLEPRDIFEVSSPKTIMEYILLEENIRIFIESFGCNVELFKISTGEEDLKKEILFNLCRSQKKFSSKLLKVLSSHLNMAKPEIENFIESCKQKCGEIVASVYQDHGYCNLYKALV